MTLHGYKLDPTGKGEWMGVYGGSEAHWADQGQMPNLHAFRWVTACGRLVQPAHFHSWGTASHPSGATYSGEPRCDECVQARTDAFVSG